MSQLTTFRTAAKIKSADERHRQKLSKAISTYNSSVSLMKSSQFVNWDDARKHASRIKDYVIDNIDTLLTTFEANIKANGAEVLWAETIEDAQHYIQEIIEQHAVSSVVKSKSMTTEEIHLNEFLEDREITVYETDLGEYIVQLAHEKPYHIVTPAMHKSKAEISRLFHEHFGIDETDNPEELTAVAREQLRTKFATADLGITGANFLIADSGAISITENEGNALLTVAAPKIHVAIVGIEKILPRLSDLSLFLPLLATSGTGQRVTAYNSIIYGPKRDDEVDGPEKMIVILLDNGRSDMFCNDDINSVLRCIRCGACLNSCPVFKSIGGHAYNTAYQGPIGSVITPHLSGIDDWGHLSAASSLCGACTSVCPVNIPIHRLLLKNREISARKIKRGDTWKIIMKWWSRVMTNRSRVDKLKRITCLIEKPIRKFLPEEKRSQLPELAKKSFSELWDNHVNSR